MDPVFGPGLSMLAASFLWLAVGMVLVARQRKKATVTTASRVVAVCIFAIATFGFVVSALVLLSA